MTAERGGGRVPYMDAMRGLAALMVLTYHVQVHVPQSGYLGTLLAMPNLGITLFFLISAILLYRPFAAAHLADRELPSVRAFAWRRVLRIVPAFWVALTLLLLLSSEADPAPGGELRYYLFAQVYAAESTFGGMGQAWSLCVEATLYMLLPLAAIAVSSIRASSAVARLRAQIALLAGLLVAGVAYKAWLSGQGADAEYLRFNLLYYLDVFAVGMGIAVALAWRDVGGGGGWTLSPRGERRCWGAAIALQVVFTAVLQQVTGWTALVLIQAEATIVGVLLLAPVLVGPRESETWVRRVVASRAALFVGVISYGVYLYHLAVAKIVGGRIVDVAPGFAGYVVAWSITLGGTLVVAYGSWVLVERRALRYKDRVPSRRPAPAPVPVTEPAP